MFTVSKQQDKRGSRQSFWNAHSRKKNKIAAKLNQIVKLWIHDWQRKDSKIEITRRSNSMTPFFKLVSSLPLKRSLLWISIWWLHLSEIWGSMQIRTPDALSEACHSWGVWLVFLCSCLLIASDFPRSHQYSEVILMRGRVSKSEAIWLFSDYLNTTSTVGYSRVDSI